MSLGLLCPLAYAANGMVDVVMRNIVNESGSSLRIDFLGLEGSSQYCSGISLTIEPGQAYRFHPEDRYYAATGGNLHHNQCGLAQLGNVKVLVPIFNNIYKVTINKLDVANRRDDYSSDFKLSVNDYGSNTSSTAITGYLYDVVYASTTTVNNRKRADEEIRQLKLVVKNTNKNIDGIDVGLSEIGPKISAAKADLDKKQGNYNSECSSNSCTQTRQKLLSQHLLNAQYIYDNYLNIKSGLEKQKNDFIASRDKTQNQLNANVSSWDKNYRNMAPDSNSFSSVTCPDLTEDTTLVFDLYIQNNFLPRLVGTRQVTSGTACHAPLNISELSGGNHLVLSATYP